MIVFLRRLRRSPLAHLTAGLVGLLLTFGALALLAPPAHAAVAAPDCKTVVSHLVDRPDNGHGTPGTWALDTMTRTVKVCHLPEAEAAPAVAKTVEVDAWTYTAALVDDGTFVTQGSATGSPNAGAAIVAGMHGTVKGVAGFAKFTAAHDWAYWNGAALDGKTFTGLAPSSTGSWIGNLWSDGFGGTQIVAYKWIYKTCTESWVDSSEEANGDGTADVAGDITGKACPSPSPSAPAPTTPAATVSATPAASLPVTGPGGTGVLLAVGAGLILGGAMLYTTVRRRRVRFTA